MLKAFKFFFSLKKYKNKKLIIAVSGGIDSVVLLYILKNIINNKLLCVCHCNFNLKKNNNSSKLIFNICYKNNIKFFFKKFNTINFIKKKKISIQMGARYLRYNWFNKILKKYKYDYIIIAHHIDDNIETFFINLLRGSGIFGLKGIKIFNNNIIRPYLKFKINKNTIKNYAKKNNIKWIEDISNLNNNYLRNKIRNNIIPFFKKKFNFFYKNIRKTLNFLYYEYNLIKNIINTHINNILYKKIYLYNKYYIIYIKDILKIKFYEFILYKFFNKYYFYNFKIFKILPYLKSGKFFYSKNNKYKIIKDKNKLVLLKNNIKEKRIKIFKNCNIYFNKKKKISFFFKKKIKKINKKFVYINCDILKLPLYITNWKQGDNYKYKNKLININKIFKKNGIYSYFKKFIFFLKDKNNNIICSINKILIFNKKFLINKNNKNILFFNFLK